EKSRIIIINNKLLYIKENLFNNLLSKRFLTIENNNSNEIKSKQSSKTITNNTIISNNENISDDNSKRFISTSIKDNKNIYETKIHVTQGELNITDPFKTFISQSDITPVKSDETASISTVEQIPQNTPQTTTEANFAPKISSTNTYSESSSITVDLPSSISTKNNKIKYETINQLKVSGGQDTYGETITNPNEDLFYIKRKNNTTQVKCIDESNEILVQREIEMRNRILHESLNFVHEKGWTMEAIHAGIKKCNQPDTAEGLFYNGYDLVDYFMRDSNTKMTNYMNELAKKDHIEGTRLLIEGLKYRLNLVIPYADVWEQALAQKGLPLNAKRAWKSLLDLANQAWLSIGDTSTDMKWYTKRISIATIYRSAEIYMLQDKSPNKIESMNFIERHLGDFETMGTVRSSVSQSLSDTAQVASGLFTVVRTMTTRHK
ncbi:unnamed protein product, partial [Rotaria sp. Silwood1]